MSKIYLYYVESNFHLLLSLSYITHIGIPVTQVYFITHRGVKLPQEYSDRHLYDGTEIRFLGRIKMYLNHRHKYKELFKGKEVLCFSPFQFRFPTRRFFSKYSFIEEGFSAYACSLPQISRKAKFYEVLKIILLNLLFPFDGNNIRGFLMGNAPSSDKVSRPTDIIVSNEQAYASSRVFTSLRRIVIPFCQPYRGVGAIRDSIIIVLDRLNQNGRPFDKITYLEVLRDALGAIGVMNKAMLVKMHPSDSIWTEQTVLVNKYFEEVDIDINIIDDDLENIALSDAGNTFIGSNSTILYYAPIMGKTNVSISFAALLAKKDAKYNDFLKLWGGVDEFCRIFAEQVTMLGL